MKVNLVDRETREIITVFCCPAAQTAVCLSWCLCVCWCHASQLLTVAVGPLHVVFHVALLGEPDAADLTLEGLLSSVFDHVNLQGTLLIEGLVALTALEGTLTCTGKQKTHTHRYYIFLKGVALLICMHYNATVRIVIHSIVLVTMMSII